MRLQRQWLTRVADTEAEAATKLGSFRFTRGTLVCCFTWPHVFMQVGVPGDNNCQFHALVDQLKQLRPTIQMRSPYGTIASIGCMPMQTCIWRSIIEIHARPLLTLLCLLQLDHPNGDNSLLCEAVVATTIYRYGHIYDDYDFDTYLRIMRRHGEHANSTVYRTHSISNSMWVADNEWGDDWTLLAFSAENKIRVRVVSSASNQVSDAHCAPPHYCTTPQYCALSECCKLAVSSAARTEQESKTE